MAIGYDLGAWLAGEKDLEVIQEALSREQVIRRAMAETGEDRQIIIDMIEAGQSMDQEAVLELTSGAPTTLADGVQAYIEALDTAEEGSKVGVDGVINHLGALLAYPWPEEEAVISTHAANAHIGLRVERPDDESLSVFVGGQEVAHANHDTHGWSGMQAVEATAEAVHRAVLARVIGDRPHHVQLNQSDRMDLMAWLERPNGTFTSDQDRLSVDAVQGGGVLIRTRPYVYVTPPRSRS